MAKTKAPLFGIRASGQLGKSLVYSSWKGVNYARERVIPQNPRTVEQMKTRNVFTWLNTLAKMAPAGFMDPFEAYAQGQALTGRNALLQANITTLRAATDISNIVTSPGTANAPRLASFSIDPTATAGQLKATASIGALPTGWTLSKVVFILLRQQDPHQAFIDTVQLQVVTATPYEYTFTGLTSAQAYVGSAYPVYTKPDGKLAYGPSLNDVATPV